MYAHANVPLPPLSRTSSSPFGRRQALFALFAAALLIVIHTVHDVLEGDPFLPALLSSGSILFQMAALTVAHRLTARKDLFNRRFVVSALVISFFCGCAFVLFHPVIPDTATFHLMDNPKPPAFDWISAVAGATSGAFGFLLWLLIVLLPDSFHRAQLQLLAAENIRREGELMRLRAGLEPHFLLNTLNAVASMVGSAPKEARRLIAALGDLLRDALDDGPEMRPFCEEFEWMKRYAEILQTRHAGMLSFDWNIDSKSDGVLLPRLLLQPLLENAIKHGALQRGGEGRVRIESARQASHAQFVIEDNGKGIPDSPRPGLGLRLVEKRLLAAYPEGRFVLENTPKGCRATVVVPLEKDLIE